MGKKRLKVVEQEKRRAKAESAQRKLAQQFLRIFNLDKEVNALPPMVKNDILLRRFPKPAVVTDSGFRSDPRVNAIAMEILHFLVTPYVRWVGKSGSGSPYIPAPNETESTKVTPLGDLTPAAFFSTFLAVQQTILHRKVSSREATDVSRLSKLLTALSERLADGVYKIGDNLWRDFIHLCCRAVSSQSRMNRDYFLFEVPLASELVKGTPLVINIHCQKPEYEYFEVELDKPRRCWRAGWGFYKSVTWLDIESKMFHGTSEQKLPVYVQEHTFTRLKERLAPFEDHVHYHLYRSLLRPNISEVQDGPYGRQYLLDYRIGKAKVGYIILRLFHKKVVAVTFKFLTMLGTPEGDALSARLRMGKSMMEWHGLHNIEAFVKSDLFDDPIVASWLNECGLGNLKQLRQGMKNGGEGYASQLKRTMGIDSEREQLILARLEGIPSTARSTCQ